MVEVCISPSTVEIPSFKSVAAKSARSVTDSLYAFPACKEIFEEVLN